MPSLTEDSPKFNICYATANENRLYTRDVQNLIRMSERHPGVDKAYLYIAVSTVKKEGAADRLFRKAITHLFDGHPHIELVEILFKENTGRDFSSYAQLFRKVNQTADAEDYTFFLNRSARGPYLDHWYADFLEQYRKFPKVAICGSTINCQDHHHRSRDLRPHVQTYAFLSQVKHLRLFEEEFPGETETVRLQIILNGEISLSEFFTSRGYVITSMEWPNLTIDACTPPPAEGDIKKAVEQKHHFYHRKFFKRNYETTIKNPILSPMAQYIKLIMKK
ncbi:hypothetical protein GCM10007049_10830 [Echinicola pacifica]|uniref:Uncharacterized protein n=1 Tax=Echinicola pacifica TaxID=346377 RepID=A0A918PS56_9BACT|nr:hypothetical protein [Echinicola pacifica]GGZ20115.1 hypothetical protein GCM10007049_10830 [Echinicola pacifica]